MMTRTEVTNRLSTRYKSITNYISAYRDFLNIQQEFIGKDNPLITKFRNVINVLDKNVEEEFKELKKDLEKMYPPTPVGRIYPTDNNVPI